MPELRCSRCDEKLSRKRARMIDGKVFCSPCMFAPKPAMNDADRAVIARARHALTRLVGLKAGDALADELFETYARRDSDTHR